MECPKIRPVEMLPLRDGQRELILIRDPDGLMEESLVVSKDVAYLFSLMNGKRTLRDIQAEYMRVFGELIFIEKLSEIVSSLDQHFLLENDRYRTRLEKLKEEYDLLEVRPPSLAGKSYPENRMDLILFLDDFFSKNEQKKDIQGKITGVLSPHIDYLRGKEVYKKTYAYLRNHSPDLIIIFGTSHKACEKMWNISLKDFSTPIDVVPVSKELKSIIKDHPILSKYVCEWPHRTEHSIELQLPLLQFVIQEKFEILPILTGSMHEYIDGTKNISDQEIEDLISSLSECLSLVGKPYIVISGADLAHIGAQFGDYYDLDFLTLNSSRVKDERLLEAIKECNAAEFFQLVKEERDERRICGLAPIYFQLRMLYDSKCELIEYKQWTDGFSSVSFAGGIFYKSNREDRI